jgi:prenyltransferase beta subunit
VKLRNELFGKYFTIVLVMICGLLLVAATDKKKEDIKFDFKKTTAYNHELATRPDFPVSVIFARNYVYSVLALGEKMDPTLRQKTINFIKNLQRQDGGFSVDSIIMETSSQNADFALETLSYLDAINAIDVGKTKTYLSSLQRPDGGFSFDAKTKESSLVTTYYAVHVLSYINSLQIIDKAKTATYIKGFEKKDTGGFAYVKETGVPNPKNTYMAIFILKTLGMLDEQTKKNAIRFLGSTPYMGKKVKYEITQTLEEQAYAIRALRLLEAEKTIKKEGAISFVKEFYIPVNGGFGPIHGYGTAPDPTYFGIQCLAELGILKRPQETQLK